MVKSKKSQEYSQFIIHGVALVAVAAWVVGVIPLIVQIFRQTSGSLSLDAYYTPLLYDLFVPIAVFGALLLWRRRKEGLALLVENVLVTSIVWMVATTILRVSDLVVATATAAGDGLAWWYVTLVACFSSLIACAVVLWYAHKQNKW